MTGRGQSIVLIGFMGAGKSSTGKALARKTGLPRFDTDEIVSSEFGLSVMEIFVRFGEEKFRDAETEALRQLSETAPAIIVTGGGIVLRPENVKMLRELGKSGEPRGRRGNAFPQNFPARDPPALADGKPARDPGGIVAGA